ncbi:MAG TPA: hypothetical protein VEZ44_16140 [bacterium]|nr:hypothetical protein [bacterium]
MIMRKLIVGCVLSFLVGSAVAAVASPGAYFEGISDVRHDNDTFRNGYAAGVYDTVSLFARAAQGGAINTQVTLSTFQCLDRRGDTLGDFRSWADSVWNGTTATDYSAAVVLMAGCGLSGRAVSGGTAAAR